MFVDQRIVSLSMADVVIYIRAEHKVSGRKAQYLARQVIKNPLASEALMPTGWHEVLHEPDVTFERRMGWSPFEFAPPGIQKKNGLEAQSAKIRFEAVEPNTHERV